MRGKDNGRPPQSLAESIENDGLGSQGREYCATDHQIQSAAVSGVFISYRREDSSGYAGRLFDILSVRFGREHTYMDLDTIKGGDNFAAVIDEKIGLCNVLLAVIGERWL